MNSAFMFQKTSETAEERTVRRARMRRVTKTTSCSCLNWALAAWSRAWSAPAALRAAMKVAKESKQRPRTTVR
jgi:hypothetical protein